ncbi:MAG: thioredoxin family protein [Alphaproteobacteria bacterium]|nr:thioredoxin family protein [Alphaproteobacteria bacterium]
MSVIANGLVAVVKQDCETCVMIEPILAQLAADGISVYSQDNPDFPATVPGVLDDRALETSFNLDIETVPTLIRMTDGKEAGRVVGWVRDEWRDFTAIADLGEDLPAFRPGCGSKSVEPGIAEELAVRFGDTPIVSRRIEVAPLEDEIEACFDRGWSDGLPVVPPTPTRVYRMLQGTTRAPDEVIGIIPPDLSPCTVEKVAINAVMAGCKPEYMPVVLAAVEAALIEEFCMHGLLCTTMFAGPMVVVNGPMARKIGMNARENALGQGNRANATIGRALQLIIRNVGGGKPGGIDRACLGNPGKYTFCFAEDEEGSNWESLSVERGFAPDASTVTLFAADGVQAISDQKSRKPESLARTFAACLRIVDHPKYVMAADAFLVVSPEHERTFINAGWTKARLKEELDELLMIPGSELVVGAGGIDEGIPLDLADKTLPKFRPGGLNIVRAGGGAGMFSAVIGGWAAGGEKGSIPVTKEITL